MKLDGKRVSGKVWKSKGWANEKEQNTSFVKWWRYGACWRAFFILVGKMYNFLQETGRSGDSTKICDYFENGSVVIDKFSRKCWDFKGIHYESISNENSEISLKNEYKAIMLKVGSAKSTVKSILLKKIFPFFK